MDPMNLFSLCQNRSFPTVICSQSARPCALSFGPGEYRDVRRRADRNRCRSLPISVRRSGRLVSFNLSHTSNVKMIPILFRILAESLARRKLCSFLGAIGLVWMEMAVCVPGEEHISADPRSGALKRHYLHESTLQRVMKHAVKLAGITKHTGCPANTFGK